MVKLNKKFTNITVKELPFLTQLRCRPENVAAFASPSDPETLNINSKGKLVKSQRYWEKNTAVIITHEYIHIILFKFGVESKTLDNIFGTDKKSRFLVDRDWKWITKKRS